MGRGAASDEPAILCYVTRGKNALNILPRAQRGRLTPSTQVPGGRRSCNL